jgi:hypothetical protein
VADIPSAGGFDGGRGAADTASVALASAGAGTDVSPVVAGAVVGSEAPAAAVVSFMGSVGGAGASTKVISIIFKHIKQHASSGKAASPFRLKDDLRCDIWQTKTGYPQ